MRYGTGRDSQSVVADRLDASVPLTAPTSRPGGVAATVATATKLTVTVPPGLAAGAVSVITAFGTVNGLYFFTTPPGVTGVCTRKATLGTAAAVSCANSLIAALEVQGHVYSLALTCSAGTATVHAPDGTVVATLACGLMAFFSPKWTSAYVVHVAGGSGGTANFSDCTGQPGCNPPPDVNPVVTGLPCDCFSLAGRALAEALVGRNRANCTDCDPVDLASSSRCRSTRWARTASRSS